MKERINLENIITIKKELADAEFFNKCQGFVYEDAIETLKPLLEIDKAACIEKLLDLFRAWHHNRYYSREIIINKFYAKMPRDEEESLQQILSEIDVNYRDLSVVLESVATSGKKLYEHCFRDVLKNLIDGLEKRLSLFTIIENLHKLYDV